MRITIATEKVSRCLFFLSIAVTLVAGAFGYGVLSGRNDYFPVPWLKNVYLDIDELLFPHDSILTTLREGPGPSIETLHPEKLAPGLLMIVGSVQGTRDTFIRIIDRKGTIIHEWIARWNDVWGDKSGNFPRERIPRGDRGMYVHGVDILPDASVVANFEHLSTFRMNTCGDVEWKLDNLGHHSVFYSDQGYIWLTAERFIPERKTGFQNHKAPLRSWTVQKLSVDGDILKEIEIIDVLIKNDLFGLLYLSSLESEDTDVKGDTLHLNDVDEFPVGVESEIFEPGDLLVSLRNINALFVFDPETLKIKFLSIGRMLRQHDPDFMPGDRISVFDNRNLKPSTGPEPLASRVLEFNARDGRSRVALDGKGRFFSSIMSVHQRLANGNILVASSGEGRVIEYAPDGTMVWQYNNRESEKANGRVFGAKLLPVSMDERFFHRRRSSCKTGGE
jgi:hypothetical protein